MKTNLYQKGSNSIEKCNLWTESSTAYEQQLRNAVEAVTADIRKISQVIYGTSDPDLLARINQSVEDASHWFLDQLGKQTNNDKRDKLADMKFHDQVLYERNYIAILCPEELGRKTLMESFDKHLSRVILTGMCVAKHTPYEETWALMDKYQYLIYYAVKKRGNLSSSF